MCMRGRDGDIKKEREGWMEERQIGGREGVRVA